ncbi:MAG TPA: hypothetical protein DDW90_08350 [Cyanobacteria bacterium UBA9971]|nr:hypothetical protein [Cyanobacteria bacterium UBA9971]
MQHKRWYDKNEALKQIMEILESSDPETQNDIANDIIQLIVNKQYDIDNFIQVINHEIPFNRNRWYDQDETMHSAVEMLKNIDETEKKELFKEILTTLLNFGAE